MSSSVGPGGTTPYQVTQAISGALLSHTKYISNLKLWDKFLIWRYTLGSGALNTSLIGIATKDQKVFWTYNFFKSYNYSRSEIGSKFRTYSRFFDDPKAIISDPRRERIASDVISLVIKALEEIILASPPIVEEFYVYKVSSRYPELETIGSGAGIVHQKPFNSTTYNPTFNFAPFIAEENTCCLHRITIGKGSQVLMIPAEYHAYPFELEVLLPFGVSFNVRRVTNEKFNYIPKELQAFIPVQDLNSLVIGAVYIIDPTSTNPVKTRMLKYYISELSEVFSF